MRIMREWTGETQKSFGESIGKSKRTIQSYELGTRVYNIDIFL